MSQKNHIARIMAVMLMIIVMVSMAGVEGSFEIKVNTVQHSIPVNGELPANDYPSVSPTPATPTPALTISVTSTTTTNQTQVSATQETANSPETGQNDFWSIINSMFDSTSDEAGNEVIPTILPTTIATTVPTSVPTTVPATIATTVSTSVPTTVPATIATTVPTPVPTTVPATIATTVPTPVLTTVPTTKATTIPTKIPTTSPTTTGTTTPTTVPTTAIELNHEIRGNGTICMATANGSFFGIVSDDGSHYVPDKIDPIFQVDGLRVTYRAMERHKRDEPHNWGTPVDLLELVQVGRVIEQRVDGNGTVEYVNLENGFYGIIADNGERYLPINLNNTFIADGLRVNFSAYPANISTISMWGTPVRLITITSTGEPAQPLIVMSGHVRWITTYPYGGNFGIAGDDGILYVPAEMDGAFKRTGLYVNFTAEKVHTDTIVPQDQGILVRLLEITLYGR